MVIVKLWGGLGNQLFQYAFGYAIAKERNTTLALDLSFYENQPGNVGKRVIDIDRMNIASYHCYTPSPIIRFLSNRYIGAITRNLPQFEVKAGNDLHYFKEPLHKYVCSLPKHPHMYFDGYWQASDYFSMYRDDVIRMFTSKVGYSDEVLFIAEDLKGAESVAIHMRKGDFGNGRLRKVGHLLEPEYYHQAVRYMREHLIEPIFYVFSDDSTWAKTVLGQSDDILYVGDICKTNALDDLHLISSCRNGIMSASTFSWWGNWLRRENGTIVVPAGEYYNVRFYESDWIRI